MSRDFLGYWGDESRDLAGHLADRLRTSLAQRRQPSRSRSIPPRPQRGRSFWSVFVLVLGYQLQNETLNDATGQTMEPRPARERLVGIFFPGEYSGVPR